MIWRKLAVLALLSACACGGGGISVPAVAPSISAENKATAGYELDFGGVADEGVCSKDGAEPVCLSGLRSSMEEGLRKVLDARFAGGGKTYKARFRFQRFSHQKGDDGVSVTFGWSFTLNAPDGEALMMLDSENESEESVAPGAPLDPALKSALGAVLDHIADDLNGAEL